MPYVPTAQVIHAEAPFTLLYLPAPQGWHDVAPGKLLNAPAAHSKHCVTPAAAPNEPAAHRLHEDADDAPCVVPNEPAAHGVHVVAPAIAEKEPPEHETQEEEEFAPSTVLNVPSAHAAQDDAPLALLNLPAPQRRQALEATSLKRPAGHTMFSGTSSHCRVVALQMKASEHGGHARATDTTPKLAVPFAHDSSSIVRLVTSSSAAASAERLAYEELPSKGGKMAALMTMLPGDQEPTSTRFGSILPAALARRLET